MGRYIQKRLLGMIPLLFLVSVGSLCPGASDAGRCGNSLLKFINAPVTEAALAKVREELGLDRPAIFQYAAWLRHVACLDLGVSYMTKKPVFDQLMLSFRYTMILTAMSAVWIGVLSLPLGVRQAGIPADLPTRSYGGLHFLEAPYHPFGGVSSGGAVCPEA